MTLRFEPDCTPHIGALAANMRLLDAQECWALGMSPETTLRASVEQSVESWVALDGNRPIAMWGLTTASFVGRTATPWLLTGIGIERHKKAFLRETKWWIENRASAMYPHLVNIVDARYEQSLRWLRWLGFKIHDPRPFGPDGVMFCTVERGSS